MFKFLDGLGGGSVKWLCKNIDNCYRVAVVWECSITGKQKEQKLSKVTEEISLWLEEDLTENYREF